MKCVTALCTARVTEGDQVGKASLMKVVTAFCTARVTESEQVVELPVAMLACARIGAVQTLKPYTLNPTT